MSATPPRPRARASRRTLAAVTSAGLAIALFSVAPHARAGSPLADDAPDVVTYGHSDDVVAFARQAAQAEGLDPLWAEDQLARARYQPSVARLIMPARMGSAKNWQAYRSRFVDSQHVREGLRFWQANEAWLDLADRRWGVPPEIVTAIIGVETFYGRVRGNFRVLDALATLAFDFPSGRSDRSGFYRDELTAFLAWCAAEQRDPARVLGSYAGAIGLPQFMPGSIRKYAVDFDDDGRIDLEHSAADVVGSVAHYFAQFGWERGQATHFAVVPPADLAARANLLAPDILPSFSAHQLLEQGATLDEAGRAHEGPLALVRLENGDQAASYVAGTRNFYVITRYNWSSYYAMAVIDLAHELRRMRPPGPAPGPQGAQSLSVDPTQASPEPDSRPRLQ